MEQSASAAEDSLYMPRRLKPIHVNKEVGEIDLLISPPVAPAKFSQAEIWPASLREREGEGADLLFSKHCLLPCLVLLHGERIPEWTQHDVLQMV